MNIVFTILFLCTTISTGIASPRLPQWRLPPFVSSHVTNGLLRGILNQQCAFYFGYSSYLWGNNAQCRHTVDLMISLLDQDFLVNTQGLQSAASFRRQLRQLLLKTEVVEYLNAIKVGAANQTTQHPFTLWNFTLTATGGNPRRALQWIAVLFQDSNAFAHVHYLANWRQEPLPLQLLTETNAVLNVSPSVSLYPQDIHSPARSQYHFYVIAYLSHELELLQPHSFFNRLVPFLFNATYSYLRYIDHHDPANAWTAFDPTVHQDSLEDIYLGFAAVNWAQHFELCPLDQSYFSRQFAANPEGFIRQWINAH